MKGRRMIIYGVCLAISALCVFPFSGCSATPVSSADDLATALQAVPSEAVEEMLSLPDACQIINPLYFSGKTSDESAAWQKKMSEKYGVTISVHAPVKDTYSDYLAANLASGQINGLFYASTPADVLQHKEAGTILPVDDYLKNNKTWNSLPEIFRNTYKYDGHIWAIPYSYQYQIPWTRYYRNDWLRKLGITSPPSTVDDFVRTVTAIATQDPDGDGKVETNLGVMGAGPSSWMDLFAACDAVMGSYGNNFLYDYDIQAYTDAMMKPGAANAFTILRNLFSRGIINSTFMTDTAAQLTERLNNGTVGSAFYIGGKAKYTFGPALYAATVKAKEKRTVDYNTSQQDWINATSVYAEVTVMTGTRTKNLWAVSPVSGAYCLSASTPQPKETVNFFVDMLFGSEENWLTALQGLPETRSKGADGTYVANYKDAKSKTTYGIPALVGSVRGVYEQENYLFFLPDATELTKLRTKEIAAYHQFLRSAEWSKGAYYYLPQQFSGIESKTYKENLAAITEAYRQLWIDAVSNPNTTVDKALEDYKNKMSTLGAQKVLDEANAAIGVKAGALYQ